MFGKGFILREENDMIIKSVNLETVCGITSKLPDNTLPEVAFAGKSNVGKSSLINALMNRKSYARISAQPGKTQTINYYNINEELYYVDLPGYGFAKVTQTVKEKWGHMIENYLQTSKQLKMVFLLIDIRHKPSKNDVMMYDWILHNGYRPVIIATKLDKLKRSQVPKHLKEIRTELQMDKETPIFPFSALSKQGSFYRNSNCMSNLYDFCNFSGILFKCQCRTVYHDRCISTADCLNDLFKWSSMV